MNKEAFNPRQVAALTHRIEARALLSALPGVDQSDLSEIRRGFATWAAGSRHGWPSWQAAWNEWVDEAPRGHVRYHQSRCGNCHGRGFDPRSLSRIGSMICHVCMGSRRGGSVMQRIKTIPLPEPRPSDQKTAVVTGQVG